MGQNWERQLWKKNQEKKMNMLLENNIILEVRQKQEHILISSTSTITKSKSVIVLNFLHLEKSKT